MPMLIEFFSKSMAVVLMAVVSFFCVLIRACAGVRTTRLLRQADDLVMAGDKQLKQLRVRYESAYRLNKGRVCAKSMTESFVNSFRLAGLPLAVTEKLHIFAVAFCAFISVSGFTVLYLNGYALKDCAAVFLSGTTLALADGLLGGIFGIHKLSEVKASLTDYMENTLCTRLAMENESKDKEKKVRQGMRDDLFMKKEETETGLELYKEPNPPAERTGGVVNERNGRKLSDKDEQLIADVLKEYLRQASGK